MFEAELHDAARIAAIVRTHRKKSLRQLLNTPELFSVVSCRNIMVPTKSDSIVLNP